MAHGSRYRKIKIRTRFFISISLMNGGEEKIFLKFRCIAVFMVTRNYFLKRKFRRTNSTMKMKTASRSKRIPGMSKVALERKKASGSDSERIERNGRRRRRK